VLQIYIKYLIDFATNYLSFSLIKFICFCSRRERHAKTLESAQEEVLTCLGLCIYERLHRINLRLREEECTCKVLAAVAIDGLCRNFKVNKEK